jgi:hypothetical protein
VGIDMDSLRGIIYAKRYGVDFKYPLTIGRQSIYMFKSKLNKILKKYNSAKSLPPPAKNIR